MDWNRINMEALERDLIALRREFHQYPESGWTEFRTTVRIIEELERLGLPVQYGPAIHAEEKRFGLPTKEKLEACWQRAKAECTRQDLLDAMRGGYTGCMTVIEGALPGPDIAVRADIDCVDIDELQDAAHRPTKEGFNSRHEGCMHACGHDAHAAIGIGIARILCAHRDLLRGRVHLIFQPAEEGLRGAASMTAAGTFSDCEALFGFHVGLMDVPVGTVAVGCHGFLASTKFDTEFLGVSAHAGLSPEKGRNALAAAAAAALEMLTLPPHPEGVSRVNVGTFHAGTGRNVIPGEAMLQVETRGATSEINHDMETAVLEICQAAAARYGCTCRTAFMGAAGSGRCDPPLVEWAEKVLSDVEGVNELLLDVALDIGEDITIAMEEVQRHGGQATELVLGMPLAAPHHNEDFDVDEQVLILGAKCLAALALESGYRNQE